MTSKLARCLYFYWHVALPFYQEVALFRSRVDLRGSAFKRSGAPISAPAGRSHHKGKSDRVVENLVLSFLAIVGLSCCFQSSGRDHFMRLTSRLGTTVIFDQMVTYDTLVQCVSWEGEFLWRTQYVCYTRVGEMHKYNQKPLDKWGWVWHYNGAEQTGNQVSLQKKEKK